MRTTLGEQRYRGITVPSTGMTRRELLASLGGLGVLAGMPGIAQAAPAGKLTWAVHISLAPTWFDPAETLGIITPFMVLYALHDAVVKPMPGELLSPGLAQSWSVAEDGLSYEFKLRPGARFHNNEPVTGEDVKFSFERYKGVAHEVLKERVASVEAPAADRVVFKLHAPWPDFLTFYATASGSGWIVPKKYVEKVGPDGFKKAPIGAGPYKFVSFTPGVELVLEAFDGYWRKPPPVKSLSWRVIPDEATRLAALKNGEVDIAYSIRGELAEEVQHTPGLTLKPTVIQSPFWLYMPEQFNADSPWHDPRVRHAAGLAIDYKTINQALTLGFSHITNSIVPDNFEFYWQPPAAEYNPEKARQLLAAAGHPNGFDAGFYTTDVSYGNLAEAVINSLGAVGIQARMRPLERAAFYKGYAEKGFKNIIQGSSGAFGNAATRMEAFVVKGGAYAYGSYPDIDALYPQQASEGDHAKRAAVLTKMQQMVHEKAMYTPVWQLAFINAVGHRVGESSFGHIAGYPYTAPYDDLTITGT